MIPKQSCKKRYETLISKCFVFLSLGGKVEECETQQQTLARELQEELEIEVEIGDFFYQVEHDYPDFHLSMTVYECKLISSELKMNVHKGIKWLQPKDMIELDWAAADIPVAEKVYNNYK